MTENLTQFPSGIITAKPTELYADIVYRQIRSARQRAYTPGPITSGWAINLTPHIPDVIAMNAEFGC